MVGYLVSVPWRLATPPELNAADCHLPEQPNCLYLHDLAVTPTARRSNTGRALLEAFMRCLYELKYRHASLIAIQSSMPYWQRYGFQVVALGNEQQAKLSSYGEKVAYMEYLARPASP